ncbi:MAG: hypothetical protein GY851_19195 [bacterium]|nr:hypothetical protein [bacterium]
MRTFALVALMGMAVAMTGCGEKTAETVSEKVIEGALKQGGAESVAVNVSDDGVSIKGTGEDGEAFSVTTSEDGGSMTMDDGNVSMVAGDNVALPDDFPKDVPLYDGMELGMAMKAAEEGAFTVMATTADAMATVAADLKKQAEAQGWTEQMTMNQAEMNMLGYSKDGRTLQFMIMRDGDKTGIQITTAKE